jgi:hypothetical protein
LLRGATRGGEFRVDERRRVHRLLVLPVAPAADSDHGQDREADEDAAVALPDLRHAVDEVVRASKGATPEAAEKAFAAVAAESPGGYRILARLRGLGIVLVEAQQRGAQAREVAQAVPDRGVVGDRRIASKGATPEAAEKAFAAVAAESPGGYRILARLRAARRSSAARKRARSRRPCPTEASSAIAA